MDHREPRPPATAARRTHCRVSTGYPGTPAAASSLTASAPARFNRPGRRRKRTASPAPPAVRIRLARQDGNRGAVTSRRTHRRVAGGSSGYPSGSGSLTASGSRGSGHRQLRPGAPRDHRQRHQSGEATASTPQSRLTAQGSESVEHVQAVHRQRIESPQLLPSGQVRVEAHRAAATGRLDSAPAVDTARADHRPAPRGIRQLTRQEVLKRRRPLFLAQRASSRIAGA